MQCFQGDNQTLGVEVVLVGSELSPRLLWEIQMELDQTKRGALRKPILGLFFMIVRPRSDNSTKPPTLIILPYQVLNRNACFR